VLSSVLPPLFYYYVCKDGKAKKFPATISFTIRKGVPRLVRISLKKYFFFSSLSHIPIRFITRFGLEDGTKCLES